MTSTSFETSGATEEIERNEKNLQSAIKLTAKRIESNEKILKSIQFVVLGCRCKSFFFVFSLQRRTDDERRRTTNGTRRTTNECTQYSRGEEGLEGLARMCVCVCCWRSCELHCRQCRCRSVRCRTLKRGAIWHFASANQIWPNNRKSSKSSAHETNVFHSLLYPMREYLSPNFIFVSVLVTFFVFAEANWFNTFFVYDSSTIRRRLSSDELRCTHSNRKSFFGNCVDCRRDRIAFGVSAQWKGGDWTCCASKRKCVIPMISEWWPLISECIN